MGRSSFVLLLAPLLSVVGCEDVPTQQSQTGPLPAVEVSLAFSDAPLEGTGHVRPMEESTGWYYAVDVDEDGVDDHAGDLEGEVEFPYRFTTPGIHRIRVRFYGRDGLQEVDVPVVVNDPSALETLAEGRIPPSNPDEPYRGSPEGIVMDPAGEHLYVGDYSGGTLTQLDSGDLRVLRRIDTMGYSIEGLSVSPSGDRLFAVYKYHKLATVAIPEMVLEHRHDGAPGKFFIHALRGSLVLVGGEIPFYLVDPVEGDVLAEAMVSTDQALWSWHFAVSEDEATAVVVSQVTDAFNSIYVVDVPSLAVRREIRLSSLSSARLVALDPHEPRAYVLGYGPGTVRFLVVDLETGEIRADLPLGPSFCNIYCVANPVAVGRGGRFVAMEWYGGAYLIDTALDLPIYRLGNYGNSLSGFSVAASPTEEDVFYFLESGGGVRKVRVR